MLFDKLITHERGTATKGAIGGTAWSYSTQTSNVAAAIYPAKAHVTSEYARRNIRVNYHIATDADLGAKIGDRFNYGGAFYVVHGVGRFDNGALGSLVVVVHDCEKVIV